MISNQFLELHANQHNRSFACLCRPSVQRHLNSNDTTAQGGSPVPKFVRSTRAPISRFSLFGPLIPITPIARGSRCFLATVVPSLMSIHVDARSRTVVGTKYRQNRTFMQCTLQTTDRDPTVNMTGIPTCAENPAQILIYLIFFHLFYWCFDLSCEKFESLKLILAPR
jgi:hypothetical protein